MSWTVRVSQGFSGTLKTEAVDGILTAEGSLADAGVVAIRGFDAPVVVPPGISKVLNLYARQDALQVEPRDIVQYLAGTVPVFWGVAVVVPSITAPGAGPHDQDRDAIERVTVVGGEQLLKESVIGPRVYDGEFDVATIAYDLCYHYAHPTLTITEANFIVSTSVLSAYYAPEETLFNALEFFASTVPGGASFWVDASGAVHFQADT